MDSILKKFALEYKKSEEMDSIEFIKGLNFDNDKVPKYILYLMEEVSEETIKKCINM